jgi:hypothetical protein
VHDIGRGRAQVPAQARGEVAHVRQQVVLRHLVRRPGVDVHHSVTLRGGHLGWQVRCVAPGEDSDLVPDPAQRRRQLGDVQVLSACVHFA